MTTADLVYRLIAEEEQRQREKIGLIPSENHMSSRVAGVLSSCLSSKYAEGYPDKRYYEGKIFDCGQAVGTIFSTAGSH